jgi:K+-sensing histidine kinase KdpD
MHRALVNLIRNATQAMPDGGTLTLEASRDETAVHLVVRDTGPGIGDEAVDRIFNPFFTTRDTGTGLGLAIVHRILDAHGGSIAVHNDPSAGGAVFTLSLPIEPPEAWGEGNAEDAAEEEAIPEIETRPGGGMAREAGAAGGGGQAVGEASPEGGAVR